MMCQTLAAEYMSSEINVHFNRAVLNFPQGLVGLPHLKHFEVIYSDEELPFMHLRETKNEGLEFVVVRPNGLIPNYSLKISDDDLQILKIKDISNVLLFNIATVHNEKEAPMRVTVNLVAPLLINANTLTGKQVIIENYQDYSADYLLYPTASPFQSSRDTSLC